MIPATLASRFLVVGGYWVERHTIDHLTDTGVLLKDGRHITGRNG